jgi:hypothetical protein
MRAAPYYFLAGLIVFLAVIAFLPALLARILDPLNMRVIRARCTALGLSDVEIEPFPNHYGVHFSRDGRKHYAKCVVAGGQIRWLSNSPEEPHA